MLYRIFLSQPFPDPFLYNCTGTNIHVESHILIGALYFSLGFIAQILYLIVLKTFWSQDGFWEHACYRIMFFLGIPDMLSLVVCSELAGIWSILGLHPCYDMELSVIFGCFVFGTWHMSCFYVLILAFNRSCELIAPKLGRVLFNGTPLTIFLCLPLFYFVYFTFFTKPLIYDVHESTFLLNPLTAVTKDFDSSLPVLIRPALIKGCINQFSIQYTVYGFIFNNFFVMFFIGINYFTLCVYILHHSCLTSIQKVSKVYRQVTIQCLVVCSCHFIGCFLYIYMQYRQLPNVFHVVAQLAWIGNHGLPPLVYIIFNKSIRSQILFCNLKAVRISAENTQKPEIRGRNSQNRIVTVS